MKSKDKPTSFIDLALSQEDTFLKPKVGENGEVELVADEEFINLAEMLKESVKAVRNDKTGNIDLQLMFQAQFMNIAQKSIINSALFQKSSSILLERLHQNPDTISNKDLSFILKTASSESSNSAKDIQALMHTMNKLRQHEAEEKQLQRKNVTMGAAGQLSDQQKKKTSSFLVDLKQKITEAAKKNTQKIFENGDEDE